MKQEKVSPLHKTFRFCWRSFRTVVVVIILVLVAAGIHLHNVGLPEPVKRRLVERLRSQGWDLEYARLRMRWMHGIVGEGLHFKPVPGRSGPQLFFERVDFRLNRQDLENFVITPETLTLHEGRCIWVLPGGGTNLSRSLALEQVRGMLRYHEPDQYHLPSLEGRFHGIALRLEASLTNASHLMRIRWPGDPRLSAAERGDSTEEFLHHLAGQLDRCRVGTNSRIVIRLNGDVLQTNSFRAEVDLDLPSVDSPWIVGSKVHLEARLIPPSAPRRPFELGWKLRGADCETPWGRSGRLEFQGSVRRAVQDPLPTQGRLELSMNGLSAPSLQVAQLDLTTTFQQESNTPSRYLATWNLRTRGIGSPVASSAGDVLEGRAVLAAPEWTPLSGEVSLRSDQVDSQSIVGRDVTMRLSFQNPATNAFWMRTNTPRGVATFRMRHPLLPRLQQIEGGIGISVGELNTPWIQATNTTWEAAWRMPLMDIGPLRAEFNRGVAELSARLDVNSRRLTAILTNTTDAHLLAPLLKTNTQRWLRQYGWVHPPWIRADVELTLPPWERLQAALPSAEPGTNTPIDFAKEVLPLFRLSGLIRMGEGDFRGARFSSATATIIGSNQLWRLPDIRAVRPEGILELDHQSDESTRNYFFKVRSSIDPGTVRPLLAASAHDDFDLFRFGSTPFIEGEIRGRWRSPELMAVTARVLMTNLSFRGETVQDLSVGYFHFSNRLFFVSNVVARRPEGTATVGQVWYSLDEKKVRLTNVASGLEIAPVCRAIGPQVAATMAEYGFGRPPKVTLNGLIDTLKARHEHDLHFQVDASDFSWKVFRLDRLSTSVHWVKDALVLDGVEGDFYSGTMRGGAEFDFSVDPGTLFRFNLAARGVDLGLLMNDISSRTNRLEGRLDCDLFITDANTRDKFTWNGRGNGQLTNGVLWDIPVFAMISPALNKMSPGLGNSRARRGVGTFTITNGVIFTDDLDIRATGMRMRSSGTVDLDKKLNARMEAELLRDTPAIGYLLSKLFWPVTKLFEFKITGTLDKPRTDQLYMVPRMLLAPFHPIRTIKDLFNSDDDKVEDKPKEPGKQEGAVP